MSQTAIYFQGLNGLRAIAALAVVVSHITLGLKEFQLNPYILGIAQDGTPKGLMLAGYGVSIFFVLSGFLITYLLQAEKEKGDIHIKKFYVRRILRIWPLYYLYLIIAVVCTLAYQQYFDVDILLFYIFYAANIPFIMGKTIGLIAHYWSLGVEEQFYLFWPLVNQKLPDAFLIPVILGMIVLLFGTKVTLHFASPNSWIESAIHITRFHCMMIGAVGAILYKQKHGWFLWFADNKLTQLLAWIVLFLAAINRFHLASIIDNELISGNTCLFVNS